MYSLKISHTHRLNNIIQSTVTLQLVYATLLFQVWFQNARAKFRRGQGDGTKDNGNEEGDNSPNPEGNNSNDEMMSDNESNELER